MNPSALRNPNFRIYLAGSLFNTHGVWIQRLTLGWLAWASTGSEFWVGAVAFLLFAPVVVLGPVFGVVADRIDRRRAASAVLVLSLLVTVALAALSGGGTLDAPALAGAAAVLGIANSAYHPLRLTLVPALVPREQLPSAVAATALVFNVSRLLGPAIAGVMLALGSVSLAFAVNALLYLPMLVALRLVQLRTTAGPLRRDPLLHELLAGMRYALGQPAISVYLLAAAITSLFGRGALELLPAFADAVFGRGSTGLAALTGAAGAGAIAAALVVTRFHADLRVLTWTGALGAGPALVLLGLVESFWIGLAVIAALGFFITLAGVGSQSLIQLHLDDAFRGRVMSLWSALGFGGTALGGLAMGLLSQAWGLSLASSGFGVACALAVGAVVLRRRAVA